jgi:glyoxylase I family protein
MTNPVTAIIPIRSTPLIHVYDMPEALQFYTGVLGFSVEASSPVIEAPEGRFPHWVRLRWGESVLMLNTAFDEGCRPPRRDDGRQAAHRDTCFYIEVPDVDDVFELLRHKIRSLDRPVETSFGMRELSLNDPDGYQICFLTTSTSARAT